MDGETIQKSVTEETVGAMLPTVGLDGKPLTKNSMIQNNDNKEEINDIEFTEAVLKYMNNAETAYDEVVEEGVGKIVGKLKERVVVSGKTCQLVVDIYMLKRKIKKCNKKGDKKCEIELKKELIQKQKELSQIKKTSSPELQKEISKIEKNLEKNTAKFDIEDLKPESINESIDDKIITEEDISIDIMEKDEDRKTLPPELKRLDEIRGRIENLFNELETAKKKLSETGEKLYENKVKGLTAKIDKLTKELKKKEKEADKIQNQEVTESSELINESYVITLDGRINYWKQMIDATEKRIKEKIEVIKKTTFAGAIKKLESEIFELRVKLKEYKKNLEELIEKKKSNELKVACASTDDVLADDDTFTEAANMEDEIRPIVEKLNSKGYKVKYASPGHKKLRKKEDKEPDGVYYNKLYSDARIMFADKYSFSDVPKYWHFREVDGCSYLDITPFTYNKNNGTPDEAFSKWKTDYMNSLKSFVDGLKSNTDKDVKESVDEFAEIFMQDLFESMGLNDLYGLEFSAVDSTIVQEEKTQDLIKELDNLLS